MIKSIFSSFGHRLRFVIGRIKFLWTPIIVTMTIFSPVRGLAHEGFSRHPEKLPRPVMMAWDATFLFLYSTENEYGIGTAFLTNVDQNYLYFTTANHVTRNRCDSDNSCPKVKLYQLGSFETAQNQGITFVPDKGLSFDQVELYKNTVNPDFAVLRVKIQPSLDRTKLPRPIKLATTHLHLKDKLYAFGFPWTVDRICGGHMPIEDQSIITKRWSSGIFVGRLRLNAKQGQNAQVLLGSTSDGLTGISGGPILNDAGELVGLVSRTAATQVNGYCYDGNEQPGSLSEHSYIVDLRAKGFSSLFSNFNSYLSHFWKPKFVPEQ